jgi:hypothetical protein
VKVKNRLKEYFPCKLAKTTEKFPFGSGNRNRSQVSEAS